MNNPNQNILRRVNQVLPSEDGLIDLMENKKIKIYQGFDPSAPNLHIGHLVGLLQLKAFQDAGHEVIFLIGDFTGMIGDPTDKSATRPKLTHEQVLENAKTYKDQAGKILNFKGKNAAKLLFNSEWLSKLNFADVLEISSNLTVQQLLERDMFQDRIKAEKPIHLHEFLYPMLQGYDSVAMEVDVEVGGNDQLFNMMTGRHLLKILKGKEKFVLTTKLLADSSGAKIGKTTGNAINLFGNPNDLFGGIMSLSDDLIIPAFTLATEVPVDTINQLENQIKESPMKIKKQLAFEITKLCQGEQVASDAQKHFESTIQSKEAPQEIEEVDVDKNTHTALNIASSLNLGESNSERKRVISQGGFYVNQEKITNPQQEIEIKGGEIVKFGKRQFKKIKE